MTRFRQEFNAESSIVRGVFERAGSALQCPTGPPEGVKSLFDAANNAYAPAFHPIFQTKILWLAFLAIVSANPSIAMSRKLLLHKLRRTIVRRQKCGRSAIFGPPRSSYARESWAKSRDRGAKFRAIYPLIHPSSNLSTMPETEIAILLTINHPGRRTRFGSSARILTSNNTSAPGFCS